MDLTPDKYHQALAYLTINSSFLGDLGLFHGRMGIVLFFAHYARVTQNKQYEDFAEILLDEIYEEIHWDLPINLENGLCGIGWGIEYLVQHGFMEGNTDEILADLDRKVMEIDPLRISDLSFRRGLAGIIFYVIARLNSYRETNKLPFDNAYLESLQKSLHRVNFIDNEVPIKLKTSLNHVLNKGKINLPVPKILISSSLSLDKPFSNILLGLEDGLTGWLWNNLHFQKSSPNLSFKKDKCVFIFDEESCSTKYGIGTYINQLLEALKCTEWKIVRISTLSNINKTLSLCTENNITSICIPKYENRGYKGLDIEKRYYRNIFFCLYKYFNCVLNPIFHINTMQCEDFAIQLKSYFPKSTLVLTVHYLNWGIYLLGDRDKLKDIIKNKNNNKILIQKSFELEKNLMMLCDKIIAISQLSKNNIISLYQIPEEKVILISHGLQDVYQPLSHEEKIMRREKYGFSEKELLLLFVGRLDPVKGIDYLVQAFSIIMKRYSNIRLIIAGDGNYNLILPQLTPIWSKITFTGFIEKSTLYELLSICDIGILPSLYEEFGYVALEMMMMMLPTIASKTTGHSELIINEISGLLVDINNNNKTDNILNLKSCIESAINNEEKCKEFAIAGRSLYLEKYTLDIFKRNMLSLYSKILEPN